MAKLLLISGSLRANSLNTHLLKAVVDLAPAGTEFEWADIGALPLFNDDLDTDDARPDAVTRFRDQIRHADGILIASPEYNYSTPGVLKNALDWGSRPGGKSVWVDKPFAVMGASPGFMGTARATQQTRAIAIDLRARVFTKGEILVANAHQAFDAQGTLVNDATRKLLFSYVENFIAFIQQG